MADVLVNCICPPEKEGNSKGTKGFALKMSNFGIHFWQRVLKVKKNETWYGGLTDMEISILGSKKTLSIVEFLLHSQPPCGKIRTTADYFLLP
jgi:hypothetical protein